MKFVKFSIFALTMGLFVASCGDNANNEGDANDTVEVVAPVETAPDTMVTMPADTMTHTDTVIMKH